MAASAAISCQSTISAAATVNESTTLCSAIGAVVVGHEGTVAEDGNADTFGSSSENIEKKKEKNGSDTIRGSLAAGNVVLESEDGVSRIDTHSIDDVISPLKNDDTVIATTGKAWNPLEEVDSALLSALCDPRERKALLRLEQVMIDFMRDNSSWSMEVGGALNAIVLHQNSGGRSNENNPGDFGIAEGQIQILSQQGMQELHQQQQQRGLKQTSFQRLILHRLADRFNVIREQIIQPYFPPVGNERGLVDVGVPPQYSPGLIRLVKTNESSIPSNLLIDIDLSLLINYKNPRARNYIGGGNEDSTKYITNNMALATLEAQPPVMVSKKSKKMVIMKRSDSTNGSGENIGLSRDSRKGNTRRKKLEDREKAYEEARARIFGMSESLGNENDGVDTDTEGIEAGQSVVLQSQDSQEYASTPISSSCHSSFSVETDAKLPLACCTEADTCVAPPSLPPTDSSTPLQEPRSYQETANITSGSVTPEAEMFRRPSLSSSTAPAVVSKAVYRNRQQEENDPDFKRRSGVRPVYIPYVTNPYSLPLGANPYVAMGQQPPPSQMIAMHNMQQQAKHSPHFYPGQAQQYQVPQDVAYATAVFNPPHQWAAPPHGYYPSLPRQQQQVQENLPQPWETRSTSSQMPTCSVAPSNRGMKSSLPQSKQPTKVPWGPGAARGDTSLLDESLTNLTVERGATGADAVAYTPEDFPALS
jgi:hypothetical protein